MSGKITVTIDASGMVIDDVLSAIDASPFGYGKCPTKIECESGYAELAEALNRRGGLRGPEDLKKLRFGDKSDVTQ